MHAVLRCNNYHRDYHNMIRNLFICLIGIAPLAMAQGSGSGTDFQPAPPPMRYTFDMSVFYGFNAAPDSTYSSDMSGIEFGGAYCLTPRQALTLSFSVAADTQEGDWFEEHGRCPEDPYDRTDISLLAGYRFTQPLGRFASLTLGAKGGLDIQRLSVDCHHWDRNGWCGDYRASGTRCGFGYAGYIEFGVRLAACTKFTVGYQYHGTTTKPVAKDCFQDARYSAKDMRWHEVRMGIDFCF